MSNTQPKGLSLGAIKKDPEFSELETATVKCSPTSTSLDTAIPATLSEIQNEKTGKKLKSPLDLLGSISVRPFTIGKKENMGLEKYDMVVFPGTAQEEQLAALERNGVVRYITGLDEFAPEVQNINDEELKEAVIRNIRTIVRDLEKKLATNVIKVDDPEFWNKVKVLKPDNIDFFSKLTLRCSNEPLFLKVKDDAFDLIKFMAIEAGGFDLVAKSYEDAQSRSVPPKWYLDKEVDTVSTRIEYKKLRNKAIGILEDLYSKNPTKLLYIAKVVDGHSAKYKNKTPLDVIYEQLDLFISGEGVEQNKGKAVNFFINVSQLDMETLKLKLLLEMLRFTNLFL